MATMQPDLEQRIRDIFAALNAHDVEKYLSCTTDDILYENVAASVVSHGKEETRANLKGMFAAIPDLKMELRSCFTAGKYECSEWVMIGTVTGTLPGGIQATGKSVSVRGVSVAERRENKLCRVSVYLDMATIMRQLGIVPAPPLK